MHGPRTCTPGAGRRRGVTRPGHDERTRLRLSRISITRSADLLRDSASFRGPLSCSPHPAAGARARDQRPPLDRTSSPGSPGRIPDKADPAPLPAQPTARPGPGSSAECRTATLTRRSPRFPSKRQYPTQHEPVKTQNIRRYVRFLALRVRSVEARRTRQSACTAQVSASGPPGRAKPGTAAARPASVPERGSNGRSST
jgi:hypothetical protein